MALAALKTYNPRAPETTREMIAYKALVGPNAVDDIRRITMQGGAPALLSAYSDYKKGTKEAEINATDLRAMDEFKKQLDRAGLAIETNLIHALAPASRELTALSREATKVVDAFLSGPGFRTLVDQATHGLEGFGKWLNGPDLENGLHAFDDFIVKIKWNEIGADIQTFGSVLHTVAGALGFIITGANKPGTPAEKAAQKLEEAKWGGNPAEIAKKIKADQAWVAAHDKGPFGLLGNALGESWKWLTTPLAGNASASVLKVAKQKGVDPVLALAAAMQESGLNPNAKGDYNKKGRATSFGIYQLHEGGELGNMTAKQAFDATTNAKFALAEFAKVAKAHPGWSPGEIAAAAQRPADRVGYARDVNAYYTAIVKAQRAARTSKPPVHVHVTNTTAARVAVSVNAAAQ
jgi:hypothetical protein